jgi:GntR family transcriptional repressor for pyruvate dehydrogenase complex
MAEQVAEMFASIGAPSEYLIHDILFHRTISQASGNPILAAVIETITSAIYEDRRKTVEHSTNLRESAEMHHEIYRAIRARNAAEARKLMEQHLIMARDAQMLERHPERKPLPARAKRQRSEARARVN